MARTTLSWREASKELGYFPALFSTVFGTPAIVSLIQIAFVTGDLAAPLQTIIDAYQQGMAAFGAIVEPLIQSVLDALVRVDLQLQPHWRHFLVMAATLWLAGMRTLVLNTQQHDFSKDFLPATLFVALRLARGAALIALGCVAVGLVRLDGGWWAQGLIAWLAAATMLAGSDVHITLSVLYGNKAGFSVGVLDDLFNTLSLVGRFAPFSVLPAFALGALLSFVPGFGDSAAIVVVMTLLTMLGLIALLAGLAAGSRTSFLSDEVGAGDARRSRNLMRYSLGLLGGFMGAALVFALHWALSH